MSYEIINISDSLRLVQLGADQASRLFELTQDNRQYLSEFLPWPTNIKVVDDSLKHINKTLENRANGTGYVYGIEYEGDIIGDISLNNVTGKDKYPEIGYWLAQEYAGKGITTKAAQAITDFGIVKLGLRDIVIRAEPNNVASNKVAEKSGYELAEHKIKNGKSFNVWHKAT